MKRAISLSVLVVSLALSGCASMYPQSREAFVDYMQNYDGLMKSQVLVKNVDVSVAFDKVASNVEAGMNTCIPTDQRTQRVSMSSWSTVSERNNPTFTKVSTDKAEFTIQQIHSSMPGQPEGGLYLLAADIIRNGKGTRLDIYSSKHYAPLVEAVEEWAKGSAACHGVGGKS